MITTCRSRWTALATTTTPPPKNCVWRQQQQRQQAAVVTDKNDEKVSISNEITFTEGSLHKKAHCFVGKKKKKKKRTLNIAISHIWICHSLDLHVYKNRALQMIHRLSTGKCVYLCAKCDESLYIYFGLLCVCAWELAVFRFIFKRYLHICFVCMHFFLSLCLLLPWSCTFELSVFRWQIKLRT